MGWTLEKLSREYATLWDSMEITRDLAAIDKTVVRILKFRPQYEEVSRLTNVPWFVVGIMDMREGGGGACRHLHNGDSLKRKTVQVPAGRPLKGSGPFTFLESACDAIQQKGYDQIRDWSVERMAFVFERYNGFGYREYRKMRSPYLWGGTSHQQPGKYVRDGVFDKSVLDPQHGCMALLKRIQDHCTDVELHSMYGATAEPDQPSPASNASAEETTSTAKKVVYGAGGGTGGLVVLDLVANSGSTINQAVAVRSGMGQLFAGVPITSLLIPLLILSLFCGAAWFFGRK